MTWTTRSRLDAIKDRQSLYTEGDLISAPPRKTNPNNHTMGPENFLKYIGRFDLKGDEIETKKFNPEQISALRNAYKEETPVRVIGCYRRDIAFVAERLQATVEEDSAIHYDRIGKSFNRYRNSFFSVLNEKNEKELWIAVFPSREYVDQTISKVSFERVTKCGQPKSRFVLGLIARNMFENTGALVNSYIPASFIHALKRLVTFLKPVDVPWISSIQSDTFGIASRQSTNQTLVFAEFPEISDSMS